MNGYFFHDLKIFSLSPSSSSTWGSGSRELWLGDRRELPLALKVQAFRIGKTRRGLLGGW